MKFSLIALALAAALPLSAQATDISYNYVEGDYASTHLYTDPGDTTLDGYKIKGSVALGNNFYGVGSYGNVSGSDIFGINADGDLTEGTVGVGYHHAISPTADWVSELSYVHDKISANAGTASADVSDNGYRISTGVRAMLGEQFELNGNVNYADVGDFGNGIGAGIGGVYHFNPTWGVTGAFDYANHDNNGSNEHTNTWTVGVRATF
jgi:hypothetical protein